MSARFDLALDRSLSLLEAGVPLEECLHRYPQYAAKLEPLLRTACLSAQALEQIEPLSKAAAAAGRQRLLRAARGQEGSQRSRVGETSRRSRPLSLRPIPRPLVAALASIVAVSLVGGSVVVAASKSLPGDALYPVKRSAERVHLSLTLDPAARQQLQQELAQERLREVRAVTTMNREVTVQFQGTVETVGSTEWTISGLQVTLSTDTRITGLPKVGAAVLVEADVQSNGVITAQELDVIAGGVVLTPGTVATPTPTTTPAPTELPTDDTEPPDEAEEIDPVDVEDDTAVDDFINRDTDDEHDDDNHHDDGHDDEHDEEHDGEHDEEHDEEHDDD